MSWDVHHLPRAEGRVFLVTGANAGIGLFVAEQLAATGAEVVLGCRTPAKADTAVSLIRERVPGANVRHIRLDVADLPALKSIVDDLGRDRLDAVVHNAGVFLDGRERRTTAQGHELMFGTNHLGHFALTAHLAPLLAATPGSRVVTTGSIAGKQAKLDPADLQTTRGYGSVRAYGRSKQAQMLFAVELDRRLRAAGSGTLSVLVHPGGSLDALTPDRPPVQVRDTVAHLRGFVSRPFLQGKDSGAWPTVRAVLGTDVRGGQLWGPRGLGLRGRPRLERVRGRVADPELAALVWAASVELTRVEPDFAH